MTDGTGRPDSAAVARLRALHPRAFRPPLAVRVLRFGLILAGAAYILYLFAWFDLTPARFIAGADDFGKIVGQMIPPSPGPLPGDIFRALFETVAMAVLGTIMAAALAFPLGFLGARNVVPQWLFHFSLRRVFDVGRGIDTLIWALVFVTAIGLGPMAGILAIFMADWPVLAKLFAEAIENASKRPVEAVRAAGGDGVQTVRFGLVPQTLPVMVSQILYFFESNVRTSTILGIVGAGGIGLQISDRIMIQEWDQVAFIILLILVVVSVIDWISEKIRKRIT